MDAPAAAAPAEVEAFVRRRNECEHWAGEEPFDDDRLRQIDTALQELKCDGLVADEADLRRRYDDAPEALRRLDSEPPL